MSIVSFFHSLWNHPWLNGTMVVMGEFGLIVSIAAFAAAIVRQRAYGLLVWAAIGGVAATGIDLLGGRLVNDPRPFVVLHVAPLFSHSNDNGFPSDHSAVAAYLAACLWFVDTPAALVATLAAACLGIARVYSLVHWPVDIIGGWLIGALPAVAAALLWRTRNGSPAHHQHF